MDWLRLASEVFLALIALLAGGAIIRMIVAAGDLRTLAVVGLLTMLVILVSAHGAKTREWRENTYW